MEEQNKPTFRQRGIYLIPNLFTISALFAGFYAIIAAMRGHYENAAIAIFVAMLMDSLDGRVARITNTTTPFGAELDSLSDMVAFGIAPALVVYTWGFTELGKFGWLAAFVYAVAVALRLARFNTQVNKSKRYFQGLACTPAAGVLAGMIWVTQDLSLTGQWVQILIACSSIFLGVLMVSNIRFRSFKDLDLRDHVPFTIILIIVLIIVFISFAPSYILAALSILYALSGPVGTILELRKKKRERKRHLQSIKKETTGK